MTEMSDYNETIIIFMEEFLTLFYVELGRIISPPSHLLLLLFPEKISVKGPKQCRFDKSSLAVITPNFGFARGNFRFPEFRSNPSHTVLA